MNKNDIYIDAFNRASGIINAAGYSCNGMFNGKEPTVKMQDIRCTQSWLRSEVFAQTSLSTFQFPFKAGLASANNPNNNGGVNPSEQRLNEQDVFFACELAFYIYMQTTNGGGTSYQYEDMTFPNPNFFNPGILNLDLMQGLWTRGTLTVKVNGDVLTPSWPIKNHMMVPLGQINAVTPSPQTGGLIETFNQVEYLNDGRCTLWPNWILNGSNLNEYILNYPQPINNIGLTSGNTKCFFVLETHGFIAQNFSSIMFNKTKAGA